MAMFGLRNMNDNKNFTTANVTSLTFFNAINPTLITSVIDITDTPDSFSRRLVSRPNSTSTSVVWSASAAEFLSVQQRGKSHEGKLSVVWPGLQSSLKTVNQKLCHLHNVYVN